MFMHDVLMRLWTLIQLLRVQNVIDSIPDWLSNSDFERMCLGMPDAGRNEVADRPHDC